ncbi:unannotated protein [freshwater metagenome]|uniref:Unannotated protein n=1 Tax=freshwater metagenome TaxID=449393 RepID=A0A6J7D3H2_9ZZZZ
MLSRVRSGESVGGSLTKTSSPAAAICFDDNAANKAASSMIPPRLALTIRSVGFAFANCAAPISPVVSAVLGM